MINCMWLTISIVSVFIALSLIVVYFKKRMNIMENAFKDHADVLQNLLTMFNNLISNDSYADNVSSVSHVKMDTNDMMFMGNMKYSNVFADPAEIFNMSYGDSIKLVHEIDPDSEKISALSDAVDVTDMPEAETCSLSDAATEPLTDAADAAIESLTDEADAVTEYLTGAVVQCVTPNEIVLDVNDLTIAATDEICHGVRSRSKYEVLKNSELSDLIQRRKLQLKGKSKKDMISVLERADLNSDVLNI